MTEKIKPNQKSKFKKLLARIWENRTYYMMLLPAFVLMFIFAYIPMYGITLAFKDYSFKQGILGSPWIGFDHFQEIFSYDQFWVSFKNTIEINLLKLLFGFPAPILLAIMLNAVSNSALKKVFQTLVYLPHFVSWVVVAGLIFSLVDVNSGAIANLLQMMTGKKIDILSEPTAFRALLVISDIWKETGWGAIIYIAALAGISTEYYEAAKIDGANVLQQFVYITIPCLMPTINLMLILRIGGIVGGGFDQVYNLYNESVYSTGDVLDTYTYRMLGDGNFEIGTAVGLFVNVINVALLLLANKIIKLMGGEGLY